jgi:chromosomal replication initiation ATPase DnaA
MRLTSDSKIAELILHDVEAYTKVSIKLMVSPSRKREVIFARYLAVFAMWRFTGLTATAIGHMFGARDHTTVLAALNSVMDWFETKDEIAYEASRKFILNLQDIFRIVRLHVNKTRTIEPYL